jgi:hypothetical protein
MKSWLPASTAIPRNCNKHKFELWPDAETGRKAATDNYFEHYVAGFKEDACSNTQKKGAHKGLQERAGHLQSLLLNGNIDSSLQFIEAFRSRNQGIGTLKLMGLHLSLCRGVTE